MNEFEKEKYLEIFKKYFPYHPHILDSKDNILKIFNNNKKWIEELNQPYLWILNLDYKKDNIKIFVDFGYGYMVMLKNDKLENIGKHIIMSADEKYIATINSSFSNKIKLYKVVEENEIIKKE